MTDPCINYEVITARGKAIMTTPDRALAIARAEADAAIYPGLKVIRVVTPAPQRFTVWTEARLRLVSA